MRTKHKESGAAHIALFVVSIVVLAAGFAGWWVWHNQQAKKKPTDNVSRSVEDAIKNAKCEYDDKDLCKFFSGWKAQDSYTVTATSKDSDGATTTSVIETSGKTDSRMKVSGPVNYETVVIGDTLYTKGGSVWYKQTIPKEEYAKYSDTTSSMLPEPETEEDTPTSAVTYKKITKEACGEYTCFKYQVIDPKDTDTTSYLWFDDEDFQLRRMQTINTNGMSYDATFGYKKVTISAPSPAQDLQPGQYIAPGMTEPVDGL
jgi:outer membrane lipoprotein-sorting protein